MINLAGIVRDGNRYATCSTGRNPGEAIYHKPDTPKNEQRGKTQFTFSIWELKKAFPILQNADNRSSANILFVLFNMESYATFDRIIFNKLECALLQFYLCNIQFH